MSLVPAGHLPIVECSVCRTAAVIRLCMPFSGEACYLWQRDCKHKSSELVMREGKTAPSPFKRKAT